MRNSKSPHHRILCSDAILAYLRSPATPLLCPRCQKRTKLYLLGDGRRKCIACGKKFSLRGKQKERSLRQLADLLLCFCLDMPATQASKITGYRQPTVDLRYRDLRQAIAGNHWSAQRIHLASTVEITDRGFSNSAFCGRCRKRSGCHGRICGDTPVFGVRIDNTGEIRLDPLADDPILRSGMYCPPIVRGTPKDPYARYGGFLCHGTFHRFMDRKESGHMRDGLEQFWSWAEERLRRHHGMRAENLGYYLKELEWKYNHRTMDPVEQAKVLVPLLPPKLLSSENRHR